MSKFVYETFTMIMAVTISLFLYFIFFGVSGTSAYVGQNADTGNHFEGLLTYMERQMERPIAKYYYDYCYIPAAHKNDGIDEALCNSVIKNSGSISWTSVTPSWKNFLPKVSGTESLATPTNLDVSNISGQTKAQEGSTTKEVSYFTSSGDVLYYNTGWY